MTSRAARAKYAIIAGLTGLYTKCSRAAALSSLIGIVDVEDIMCDVMRVAKTRYQM